MQHNTEISKLAAAAALIFVVTAHAADKAPVVSRVFVTNDSSLTLDVIGESFLEGATPPTVTVGGIPMVVDTASMTDTYIVASRPYPLTAGDYLLEITNKKGSVTYDLTIGTEPAPLELTTYVRSASSGVFAIASCAADEQLTGGGADTGGQGGNIVYNAPCKTGANANSWCVGVDTTDVVTAFAVCAKLIEQP